MSDQDAMTVEVGDTVEFKGEGLYGQIIEDRGIVRAVYKNGAIKIACGTLYYCVPLESVVLLSKGD